LKQQRARILNHAALLVVAGFGGIFIGAAFSANLQPLLLVPVLFALVVMWFLLETMHRESFQPEMPAYLEQVSVRQALVELALVAGVAWLATATLHNFTENVQLSGVDTVHLTRSADFAGQVLRESGRIPLWDPFIGHGQPMLESAQSFVLNPLMSVPIMLLGAVPGVLVVVILHAMIIGWGGWTWARVMGFGPAGRLLMGALLTCSGSFVGTLSHGVFQLGISQAYLPFVFAGVIAMLYVPGQRWGMVLFVTATTLLIFSGSFWYVLPAAFGCALIAIMALIPWRTTTLRAVSGRIGLLVLAGVLIVGVAGVRLFTINRELLEHPLHSYDFVLSFSQVLRNYFDPSYTDDVGQWFVVYHYVVPAAFAGLMAVGGLLTVPWTRHRLTGGWRVVSAGIVFVLVLSFFGTGPTPEVNAVYEALPFLKDWRNPGRMAAAASPWLALAVCWCFDRLARGMWRLANQNGPALALGAGGLVAVLAAGAISVADVARNWPAGLFLRDRAPHFFEQVLAAQALRDRYPGQFLAIHAGWLEHYGFNDYQIRHPLGDNEVFTVGMPSTIGSDNPGQRLMYLEQFSLGDWPDGNNQLWLDENGYIEMEGVPLVPGLGPVLDETANFVPYAYIVPEAEIVASAPDRLSRNQVQPVTYYHRIHEVAVEVPALPQEQVLVIQEAAYPGWEVRINGEPARLESVHRRLAVRLPESESPAVVVFSYRPPRLYLGALVTVTGIVLLAGYALRVDRRLVRRRTSA
jgi:hypothetical protein